MKKRICFFLLLIAIAVLSVSCSDSNAITGDVKSDDIGFSPKDEALHFSDIGSANVPENNFIGITTGVESLKTAEPFENNNAALTAIGNFGYQTDSGIYIDDAHAFARAIKDAKLDVVSVYTGGVPENYSFLRDVTISSYSVYPFRFSDEVVAAYSADGKFICVEDCYMVSFDVTESDSEEFVVGENVRFMGFVNDEVSGCRLCAFVSPELIGYTAFQKVNFDYTDEVVKEFSSLYAPKLADGKYNPRNFELKDSVHLITHLMIKSRRYKPEPPYTLDEVNGFVYEAFSENPGMGTDVEDLSDAWSLKIEFSEDGQPCYLLSCGMDHEKAVAESVIEKNEKDNRVDYTVTLYSDYSYFAKAKILTFTFKKTDGAIPRLASVTQSESTGRAVAYTVS